MATSECTRLTVFPRVHKPNEMENFIYISERYLFNSFFRSYVSIIIMRFSQQTESKSFFCYFSFQVDGECCCCCIRQNVNIINEK